MKSSAIYTPNAYEVICRVARMAEQLRLEDVAVIYLYLPLNLQENKSYVTGITWREQILKL